MAEQDGQLVQVAYAASAAQAAASAADRHVAALEHDLLQLRGDAQQQRATTAQLRQELARAAGNDRSLWVLAALVLALGCCTTWLGLRLRAMQRERLAWNRAAGGAHADAPAATRVAGTNVDAARAAGPGPVVRPALLPPEARTGPASTPPARVDELIDVEQQTDFFIALGEEQAAVDLLQAHLRGSAGASPLLHLRLLEICKGRADRGTYERICSHFDERFGIAAPRWDAVLAHGCGLQDYPAVLRALQSAWPAPPEAMAKLEALLFRQPDNEVLDLPAYRDVLTLYAVARDLNRGEGLDGRGVDVLLPLAQGRDGGATAGPSIFDRCAADAEPGSARALDRHPAPVDLDLGEAAPAQPPPQVVATLGRVV